MATTPPKSTENKSNEIEYKIIFVLKTNRIPCPMLFSTPSVSCTGSIGVSPIREYNTREISTKAVAITMVFANPNHAYKNPESTGPRIAPTCHAELPHVAAFSYKGGGTRMPRNDVVVGE